VVETAARSAEDSAINSALVVETAARSAGDSTLNSALVVETAARSAGDSTLNSALVVETAARSAEDSAINSALVVETAARSSGDSALNSALVVETAARSSGDSALTSALAVESATRSSGDSVLTSSLSVESATRSSADSVLTSAIASESSTRAIVDTKSKESIWFGKPGATAVRELINLNTGSGKTLINTPSAIFLEKLIEGILGSQIPGQLDVYVNGILVAPAYDGATNNYKVFLPSDLVGAAVDPAKFTIGDYAFYKDISGPLFRIVFRFSILSTDVITVKYNRNF